jgi:SpoVK/Ycf46/Vps4 family AAA+-type ATPase
VFLAATSNNITALPPEMLRKGRFDEIFFVDLPNAEVRTALYSVHLRKRGRDVAAFDLPALAAATNGFSGAEIEQSIVSAAHSLKSGNSLRKFCSRKSAARSPSASLVPRIFKQFAIGQRPALCPRTRRA